MPASCRFHCPPVPFDEAGGRRLGDLTFTPRQRRSRSCGHWHREPLPQDREGPSTRGPEGHRHLEEHAAFTRIGPGSAAQINTTGLIIAAFDHRDSRAGDPNLHTHITVSNKVCAIGPDGTQRWLALDGAALYREIVVASEVYNTAIEAELVALGFRFVGTDRGNGKRCVREIAGVPTELIARFSSRRAAIEARLGSCLRPSRTSTAAEPTLAESLVLSQQATLDTRAAKHEPRSLGEQRQAWRTQAVEVLGGVREVDAMVAAVSSHTVMTPAALDDNAVNRLAVATIERVSASRSTWRAHHVRAEAERQIRYANRAGDSDAVERIVSAALGEHSIAVARQMDAERGEPDVLRRRDGASVYTRHGETVYPARRCWALSDASWRPPTTVMAASRTTPRSRWRCWRPSERASAQ